MAIKFNIKKYEQIRTEYIAYLEKGNVSAISLRNFESYKIYLDADDEVKKARETMRSPQKRTAVTAELAKKEKANVQIPQNLVSASLKEFEFWKQRIQFSVSKLNIGTEGCMKMVSEIQKDSTLITEHKQLLLKMLGQLTEIIEKEKELFKQPKPTNKRSSFYKAKHSATYSGSSVFSGKFSLRPISNYKNK